MATRVQGQAQKSGSVVEVFPLPIGVFPADHIPALLGTQIDGCTKSISKYDQHFVDEQTNK